VVLNHFTVPVGISRVSFLLVNALRKFSTVSGCPFIRAHRLLCISASKRVPEKVETRIRIAWAVKKSKKNRQTPRGILVNKPHKQE
jgi:hypothetical protein